MKFRKKELDITTIQIYSPNLESKLALPNIGTQICAVFPSLAEDYLESSLDLNRELIKNPCATFFGRVKGQSMIDAGVDDGDLLVIDKSLVYKKDALAVCFIDGDFTLKRIATNGDQIILMPANKDYAPIPVPKDADFAVWGIVTYIIKKAY